MCGSGQQKHVWNQAKHHKESAKLKKQWQLGDKCTEKITETPKDAHLEDWTSWEKKVRDTAHENRKDTKRSRDPILMSLLAQFQTVSGTDTVERKSLSKRIRRRKRHLNREAIEQVIQSAAADGRAPPGLRPSLHVRWDRLLEGKEASPEDLLTEYLRELCGPQEDAKAKAAEASAFAYSGWFNVEDEVREAGTSGLDATGFAAALKKLEREEQPRRTDCRSPAESSPGAESTTLSRHDEADAFAGSARGVVRNHGSDGA